MFYFSILLFSRSALAQYVEMVALKTDFFEQPIDQEPYLFYYYFQQSPCFPFLPLSKFKETESEYKCLFPTKVGEKIPQSKSVYDPSVLRIYYTALKLIMNGVQCVLSDCYVNRMVRCCAEMNRLTQVKVVSRNEWKIISGLIKK